MGDSTLVAADRVKVFDASRAQDYTVTATQLSALLVDGTKTLANALQASFKDGLLTIGTLAIDATAEKFKTTTTAYFRVGSIQYSKAAATAIAFSSADTINTAAAAGTFWGIWLVQVNAAGTVSTKSPSADQVYTTAALALAALPSADSGKVALGYIRVNSKAGVKWTATTDDLTDGSDCTTATFTDATPLTAFTAGQAS